MVFLRCILYRKVSKISKGNEKMRKRNYIGKKIRGNCSGNPPKGNLEKIREIIGNLQLVVRIRGGNIFKNNF